MPFARRRTTRSGRVETRAARQLAAASTSKAATLNVHGEKRQRERERERERERDLQGKHYFDLTCSAFYSKVSSLELHRRRLDRLRLRGSVTGARTTPAACAQTAFTGVWPLGRG